VENWLASTQKFGVEILPERPNPAVSLSGVQTMEVPPLATKDYILRFVAAKEVSTDYGVWEEDYGTWEED
jgi:hypothetical protein